MSYSFDGANDRLTGTLAATYGDPVTLAAWFKFTDHPIAIDNIVNLGNSNSSVNDSYAIRCTATDNEFAAASTASAGGTSNATATKAGIDATWVPFIGVFTNEDLRDVYISDQTGQNTVNRIMTDSVQFIAIGENLGGAHDFTGLIAEVAIWNKALDADERASFIAGTAASQIAAANLIAYYPLNADGVLTNEGVDTGGDLTAAGAVFDADHPTITIPSARRPARRGLMGVGR